MSQEAVEVVRNAFEGAGARGLQETAETYWHPEVEYEEDPRWPGASRYKGRDAVLRCFQAYMEALGREEDLTVTVERVFDAGERQCRSSGFNAALRAAAYHSSICGATWSR